jgi:hypothetical protein
MEFWLFKDVDDPGTTEAEILQNLNPYLRQTRAVRYP